MAVLNDDENVRYDSLVLIDEFGIKRALPALTELAPRLKRSKAPGAPYELQKVQSILSKTFQLDLPSFRCRGSGQFPSELPDRYCGALQVLVQRAVIRQRRTQAILAV